MNNINLASFLASNFDLDQQPIDELIAKCKTMNFRKGDYLLHPGQTCRQIFFVEQGLLRMFSIDNKGKEHILQFAPEQWLVTDRESTYFNEPSAYYIQALEDSQVVLIDNPFIKLLSKTIPNFNDFNEDLLHNHIRHLQSRINLLLSASAEERYLHFVTLYPAIPLRVPQTMIASYLGITPETLSRVRKELARKNDKN